MEFGFISDFSNMFAPFVSAFSTLFEVFAQPVGNTGFTIFGMLAGAGVGVYVTYTIVKWVLDIVL